MPKPDRKIDIDYRSISLMNIDAKILKFLQMEFSNRSKSSYTMIKLGLILVSRDAGFFNICKSINVIYHINKLKDKNRLIISIDAEKAFDWVMMAS